MATVFAALAIGAVWLGLTSYMGVGLAYLLAPATLRSRWWLLAPYLGYVLAAGLGFFLTTNGLTLATALGVGLALATLVNLAALPVAWRSRSSSLAVAPIRHNRRQQWSDLLIASGLAGVAVLTWWLTLWPVFSYGRLMPIGHNWDVEFYLPLADYLRTYSYATLPEAPPNPLLPVILALPTSARAIGFAYVQGMVDLLWGGAAFESFAPLLALLRALGVPALYLLARRGLGMSRRGALLGTLLASLNSLLLWISYNSFAMQVVATPLLPLALLLALLALRTPDWRAVVCAGLLLAGLTLSYYPLLLPYAALALPLGVLALWENLWPSVEDRAQRATGPSGGMLSLPLGVRNCGGVILRTLALLALGVVLSLPAHLRARAAFLNTFEQQTPSMGIDFFVTPSVAAGTAPFSHLALPFEAHVWPAWLGLAALLLLLVLAFGRGGWRRAYGAGLMLAFTAYALWLRFGVAFPYGYLKGVSYASFVPLLLAGAALPQVTGDRLQATGKQHPDLGLWVAYVAGLVATLSIFWASYLTAQVYVGRPGIYSRDDGLARELPAALAEPGPVLISSSTALRGPYVGLLGLTLAARELLGKNDAGFGRLDHLPPGVAPTYGIFAAGEDPAAWGFEREAVVWQSARAVALRAPAERRALLQGRLNAYSEPTLGAQEDDGALAVTRLGVGEHRVATPEAPLAVYASADRLAFEPLATTLAAGSAADAPATGVAAEGAASGAASSDVPRQLRLALVSFGAQQIVLESAGEPFTVTLVPGLNYVTSPPLASPFVVELRPTTVPVYLRWAELYEQATTGVQPDDALLAYRAEGELTESGASLRVAFGNGSGQALRAVLEFYQNSGNAPAHPTSAVFAVPTAETVNLTIDAAARTATLNGAPLAIQQLADAPEGSYFVSLWIYQGEEPRAALPLLAYR